MTLFKKNNNHKYDLDADGKVTPEELETIAQIHELESKIEKQATQGRIAWVAMLAMVLFTLVLFSPWVPLDRLEVISKFSDLFYIAHASIVGAFMGFQAWMSRK